MLAPTLTASPASAHNIQRGGIAYAGTLSRADLMKCVPGAFAESAHESRSARYTYVPTIDIIDGMRDAGFLPVKGTQANCRTEDKKDFGKHLIRFRREDQLGATEAREIILKNSHDGSSAYEMSAGIFRLVCSNGLVVGNEDIIHKVRHSGQALGEVIDVASRIVDQFDLVDQDIDLMKSARLDTGLQLALANAAIAARFDTPEPPVTAEQVLRPRRQADVGTDAWTVFNRTQENIIKGRLFGTAKDAHGRTTHRRTREVKGIDQNTALNRALWTLGVEVAKLAR